jgi:hypothetical protein
MGLVDVSGIDVGEGLRIRRTARSVFSKRAPRCVARDRVAPG